VFFVISAVENSVQFGAAEVAEDRRNQRATGESAPDDLASQASEAARLTRSSASASSAVISQPRAPAFSAA